MFICLLSYSKTVMADASGEKLSVKTRATLGGMVVSGNLSQVMLNGSAHVNSSTPSYGNDLLMNGYRIWTKVPNTVGLTKIGDDLAVTSLPFKYITPKIFIIGTARYESSQLHQLEHRYLGGMGIGYAPIRTKEYLARISIGGHFEHSIYPSANFNLQTRHDENTRSVSRVAVVSNGWMTKKQKPVSFRYLAWIFLNPLDISDYRINVSPSMRFHISKTLGINLSMLFNYSSVVMEGVEPLDLRFTFGMSFQLPRQKK